MGIRDFFRRIFGPDPVPFPEEGEVGNSDESEKEPARVRPEADPLDELAGLPVPEGVRRVRKALDGAQLSRMASISLMRWLRDHAEHPDLTAEARLELADFFLSRGDREATDRVLRALAAGPLADAPAAMTRLGDLAAESGDVAGALGWYEAALAIDLQYPGARERHARLKRPAKAGEAGATLLAPESSVAVGRFELLRELGRGGAGAVYLARDKRVGREVALKIYHPQARADRNARLRGEAQVAAAVASPCVVRVHDLFEEAGAIAMEHAGGGSLRARVARAKPAPAEAIGWLDDVARALAATHARRWVHRDLKPGNVLLRADGRAVLTDYGLARRAGVAASAFEGTPGYVPPEAADGAPADPVADVFAFGALARELCPGPTGALASLVDDCLARDPSLRPRDGAALVARIARLA
ncbi:MAG: serine/threonine-protein kinase [Polyangiales bacterium]